MKFLFFLFLIFSLSTFTYSRNIELQNSVQAGLEFDSNVYRTFSGSQQDGLIRILFRQKGLTLLNDNISLSWIYQGGGKKYFTQEAQDTIIQYLELPFIYKFSEKSSMLIHQDIRYQKEDSGTDVNLQDLNEDYFSYNAKIAPKIRPVDDLNIEPFIQFMYFNFFPAQNYSFLREGAGIRTAYSFAENYSLGSLYSFGRQQFIDTSRDDTDHQVSVSLSRFGGWFSSLSYTFDRNSSSQPGFAFDRHQISTVISYSFGEKKRDEISQDDDSNLLFTLHFLANLQLKNYPAVFNFNSEGQRFLQTGAEDENFNSLVLKLSYHLKKWLALETKFTRYSNEFSEQESKFLRMMAYGGIRGKF